MRKSQVSCVLQITPGKTRKSRVYQEHDTHNEIVYACNYADGRRWRFAAACLAPRGSPLLSPHARWWACVSPAPSVGIGRPLAVQVGPPFQAGSWLSGRTHSYPQDKYFILTYPNLPTKCITKPFLICKDILINP
jgi:hypothetical protein